VINKNYGEKTMKIFDNKGGADWLFNIILSSLKKRKSVQDDELVSKLIDEPNKSKYDKLYLLDRAKDYADSKAMAIILEIENFFREVKD
jgi:predicted negative regulator of RcsB-dependent stress response